MALQKKYFYQFKQIGTDDVNIVELWQETTDTLIAEEVTGMASPFIVELPDLDNKFQVVIGKGCEVRLLSETDRKFLTGLYHVDPVEFQVRHYINGTLNYLGYLNSEMYQESFSDEFNYGISVTGNDGFALADRFTFLDETEENYTGIKSKFEILMICLQRIGLPYSEVRISLATTFTGYSGDANSSIMHESYVDCANFYDEDDYPMTIREVIESILAPYGAHIWTEGSIVYIIDIHTKASGGNVTFKRFDYDLYWSLQTGTVVWSLSYSTTLNYDTILDEDGTAYIADIVINIDKVVQNIGYSGTGQSIELSGGVNKQVIAYSPYPTDAIVDESMSEYEEFDTVPTVWTDNGIYLEKTLSNSTIWEDIQSDALKFKFETSAYKNDSFGPVMKFFSTYPTYYELTRLKNPPFFSIGVPQALENSILKYELYFKLKFNILYRNFSNPYDYGTYTGKAYGHRFYFAISIGDYYFSNELAIPAWTQDSSNRLIVEINDFQYDFWTEIIEKIPIANQLSALVASGDVQIRLYSQMMRKTVSDTWEDDDNSTYPEIWIQNISLTPYLSGYDTIPTDDVEYIGELNSTYKEEGERIELKCGTNKYFTDRGKILRVSGSAYRPTTEWTRASNTAKIEELLLVSATSNYQRGFYKLNNFRLRQEFTFMNLFTDNNIADKVFMLKSAKFDYEMNDVECSLIEISPDTLTIDKTELSVPRSTRNGRIYNAKSL